MKIMVAFIFGLLMFTAGCSSSQPAPKPLSSIPQISEQEMRQKIKDAEAQQPCSEQNLRASSEEQRRKCNPTQGMFDDVKPKQPVRPASVKTQKP